MKKQPNDYRFIDSDCETEHLIRGFRVIAEIVGVILLIGIIAAIITAICSITVPAKADGTNDFPSYWQHDATLVKNTQRALRVFGEKLKVDGSFGPKTAQAVKNLQQKYGDTPTGVVDDSFAWSFRVKNWEQGQGYTLYYMADLETIYDNSDYEDLIYISLGGRARTPHFSLFRDGKLVAETALSQENDLPVGVFTLGELTQLEFFIPEDLSDWLYANESEFITVVIDDRNFQPSSIGYQDLIKDTDYADWD